MSSETPRTERVVRHTSEIASGEVVRADFARQLERELAAMTARAEAAERDAERLQATIAAKDEAITRLNGWLDNDRRALGEE